MKKITLIIAVLLTLLGYSQEKYTSYESVYYEKEFNIDVSEKNDFYSFWIDAYSIDSRSKKVSLKVSEKLLPNFIDLLKKSKSKFIEWTKVAKENKIDDLNKKVEFKSKKYTVAFLYGDWQYDYKVKLVATYLITENRYIMLIENEYNLQSSSNQFIKSDGFQIVFEAEKEFDEFISKMDIEKAKGKIYNKEKKDELFKN